MKLSPNERKVLRLLPRKGRRISTEALALKFYEGKVPFNGRIVVAGLTRNLARKVPGFKRTERAGPHSIEVWMEG